MRRWARECGMAFLPAITIPGTANLGERGVFKPFNDDANCSTLGAKGGRQNHTSACGSNAATPIVVLPSHHCTLFFLARPAEKNLPPAHCSNLANSTKYIARDSPTATTMRAFAPAVAIFFSLSALPGPAAELPACSVDEDMCQNDAGTGADAPDTPEGAPLVRLDTPYDAELLAQPSIVGNAVAGDQHDWYKIKLKANRKVTLQLEILEQRAAALDPFVTALDFVQIRLLTPGRVTAAVVGLQQTGIAAEDYAITTEAGAWMIHVRTNTVGTAYRFSLADEDPAKTFAVHSGNGWLAFGYRIGEKGGSVQPIMTGRLAWTNPSDQGQLQFQDLAFQDGKLVILHTIGFGVTPSSKPSVGIQVADLLYEASFGVEDEGVRWERWPLFRHDAPGEYFIVITGVMSNSYQVIEASSTGDVSFYAPTHGESDTTYALEQEDFSGGVGAYTPRARVAAGLAAEVAPQHTLVGFHYCAQSCKIIYPNGTQEVPPKGFYDLLGGSGTWQFVRDVEAHNADSADRILVLAADVDLPSCEKPKGKACTHPLGRGAS